MKRLLVIAVIFKCSFASAAPCHAGKYIVGISGNYGWAGKTGIYVSDTINGNPNPAWAIGFAEADTSATAKILYSMAQDAMYMHQKIHSMECNSSGHISSFSVVRSSY